MPVRIFVMLSFVTLMSCSTDTNDTSVSFRGFTGDLLVLTDTDMPAFAYANGILEPNIAQEDAVYLLSGGTRPVLQGGVSASNTVTTWPNAMAVSADGRFAYVIEGRKGAPSDVRRVDDVQEALAPGNRMTVLSRGTNGSWSFLTEVETAPFPTGIAVSPDGRYIVVSTATEGINLQVFALENGRPDRPIAIDVPVMGGVGPDQGKVTSVAWHPQEDILALNLGGNSVGVARLQRDNSDTFIGAVLEEQTVQVGELLSIMRWSADGRFLYALDTGWGDRTIDRVLNGPGSIHVMSLSNNAPALVGSVPSGLSSENFAISPDGRLLATLNMERTYLPSGFPTGLIRGRSASSVSLFAIDQSTGLPTPRGEPVRFAGVLPQGIAFDGPGRALAVAVFQDHDAASTEGWIEFFHIEGTGTDTALRKTDYRVATPRGAHDLVLLQ